MASSGLIFFLCFRGGDGGKLCYTSISQMSVDIGITHRTSEWEDTLAHCKNPDSVSMELKFCISNQVMALTTLMSGTVI